jgi:hypothetical protein
VQALERTEPGTRWWTAALASLGAVQGLGLVGLALQLY